MVVLVALLLHPIAKLESDFDPFPRIHIVFREGGRTLSFVRGGSYKVMNESLKALATARMKLWVLILETARMTRRNRIG